MTRPNIHFKNIADYFKKMGRAEPEHPLFAISSVQANNSKGSYDCFDEGQSISTDFYAIGFKKVINGDVVYGKTKYDCQNGTMVFFSPNQRIYAGGVKVEANGRTIIFHEDFVKGHPVYDQIKKCTFFDYFVNEALHLSPKEEALMNTVFDNIEQEYHGSYDEFSRHIILSHLSTLLTYSDRYYRRQFLLRQECQSSTFDAFAKCFESCVLNQSCLDVPTVSDISKLMLMTPRYLSDALKVETGKSAQEWIHLKLMDEAKNRLLSSSEPVSNVAYALGFEYPQYFSRLFKKKVGVTPTEFRKQRR